MVPEGGGQPFWAPGQPLDRFFCRKRSETDRHRWRIAQTLATASGSARGGSWGLDGTILFATFGSPLQRFQPQAANRARSRRSSPFGVTSLSAVPSGRHALPLLRERQSRVTRHLSRNTRPANSTRLTAADAAAVFLPRTGFLFATQGMITARQLDAERSVLVGPSNTVVEAPSDQPVFAAGSVVSSTAIIAFRAYGSERRALRCTDS